MLPLGVLTFLSSRKDRTLAMLLSLKIRWEDFLNPWSWIIIQNEKCIIKRSRWIPFFIAGEGANIIHNIVLLHVWNKRLTSLQPESSSSRAMRMRPSCISWKRSWISMGGSHWKLKEWWRRKKGELEWKKGGKRLIWFYFK